MAKNTRVHYWTDSGMVKVLITIRMATSSTETSLKIINLVKEFTKRMLETKYLVLGTGTTCPMSR